MAWLNGNSAAWEAAGALTRADGNTKTPLLLDPYLPFAVGKSGPLPSRTLLSRLTTAAAPRRIARPIAGCVSKKHQQVVSASGDSYVLCASYVRAFTAAKTGHDSCAAGASYGPSTRMNSSVPKSIRR
jgi:hypothetical protein